MTTLRAGLAGADLGAQVDTLGLLLDLVNDVNGETSDDP